jgi:choline dehydrogenase
MYDYVVVGAGSAGCVLANRLSENGKHRVLLLEAGPRDRNIWLKIPVGISRVFVHPTLNWGYMTDEEPHLNNRKIYWPRGKTLGGSSAINGMAYVRGQPEDYDNWRQSGNTGWAWDDVLPFFKKSERQEHGASEAHGGDGEMAVSDPCVRHAAAKAFISAGVKTGLPRNDDFNDGKQEGVGFLQFTINGGVRHSTASAFLTPARNRPNLRIETGAQAARLLFDGRRVRGLVYRIGDKEHEVTAKEVILSAGVINSPQLLMVSGIGPAGHLREHGIGIAHDLPGVGQNLHDHLYIHYRAATDPDFSINNKINGWRILPHVLQYALQRRGLLTLAASQACAFARSGSHVERPDLQINFRPMSTIFSPEGKLLSDTFPGVTASCCHLRPQSRGHLRLQSNDPYQPPHMVANYLAEEEDRRAMIAGVRWMRRIFETSPMAEHVVRENAPGTQCQSDEEILAFIREEAQSMYHPVGTCKMGQDGNAVVDERLRVHGIGGLRVADASIMPNISSGNTNAPAIMIAEKGADMILQDAAGGRAA